jgi:DNA polymerase-4
VGDDLFREAWNLLKRVSWTGKRVRLLGVTATRLLHAADSPRGQMGLFDHASDSRRTLARTVDVIRDRFGADAIARASLLQKNRQRQRQG